MFWAGLAISGIMQLLAVAGGAWQGVDIKFLLPYSVYGGMNLLVGLIGVLK